MVWFLECSAGVFFPSFLSAVEGGTQQIQAVSQVTCKGYDYEIHLGHDPKVGPTWFGRIWINPYGLVCDFTQLDLGFGDDL